MRPHEFAPARSPGENDGMVMVPELDGFDRRQLRFYTTFGQVTGSVRTNDGISTLHYLNVTASTQDFLRLDAEPDDETAETTPLALAVSSVLFAVELEERRPKPQDAKAAAAFRRTPMSVDLPGFHLEGFVHRPAHIDVITRVNADRKAFFAMSSASVLGQQDQFAAGFLAVRRGAILLARPIPDVAEDEADVVSLADATT